MKVENTTREIMFSSEMDILILSELTAGQEYNVSLMDEDYQHLFCEMQLVADNHGQIVISSFADILNDYLLTTPSNISLRIDGTKMDKTICFIPAKIQIMEPAVTYVRHYPLSTVRGVKTCFAGHQEILPVFLKVGEYTLSLSVSCNGQQFFENKSVTIENMDESRELVINPFRILKAHGIDSKYCFVKAEVYNENTSIVQNYNFQRPPYGGKTLMFLNSFGQHETMPIALTERKTKADRQIANVRGKSVVYQVKENTTVEVLSYPLRDGEEEMAADFIRSKEISDEKGISYILKDGEIKAKSDETEIIQMKAVLQQQGRITKFDGSRPRIFDDTFDNTFE